MKIELKKAITHKGEQIHTLDIPLDDLTGNDIIEAEKRIGNPAQSTNFSRDFQITLAAMVLHMPVEVLKNQLSGRDFMKITNRVSSFLWDSDSSEETEETPATPLETSSGE